jgi:hypothetical protein
MCASDDSQHIDEQTPMEDPLAGLEKMFIEEYLKEKGYRWCELAKLDPHEMKKLMTEACMYATTKLADIEAKTGFRHNITYKK